jgi:DNA-binding transcriptional MerR regulator
MDEERYGIAELAEAADVSVRTVRYYIGEGLLPPPVTAGARSYYTREHLARLQLIGHLKDAYLPLREIRRQLASLDEETIRELVEAEILAELEEADEEVKRVEEAARSFQVEIDGQAIGDYIRSQFPPGFPFHTSEPPPEKKDRKREDHGHKARKQGVSNPGTASAYIAQVLNSRYRERGRPNRPDEARIPTPPSAPRPPLETDVLAMGAPNDEQSSGYQGELPWIRIRIGDEVELLIREDAWGRRREKIDWLIGWATKVFK